METLIRRIEPPQDFTKGAFPVPELLIPQELLYFCAPKSFDSHKGQHDRFVLIQNFGGRGTVCVDDRLIPFAPYDALLIFPFQQHYYIDVDKNPLWLFTTFTVPIDFSLAIIQPLRFSITRMGKEEVKITQKVLGLYKNSISLRNARTLTLLEAELLNNFLLQTLKHQKTIEVNPDKPKPLVSFMDSLLPLIHQQMDKPLSIDDLATAMCCSSSHLRLLFRRHFNMSLGAYIREAKNSHACKLLRTTDESISSIASQCGFESVYAFSRAFKAMTGVSPRQYRNEG